MLFEGFCALRWQSVRKCLILESQVLSSPHPTYPQQRAFECGQIKRFDIMRLRAKRRRDTAKEMNKPRTN